MTELLCARCGDPIDSTDPIIYTRMEDGKLIAGRALEGEAAVAPEAGEMYHERCYAALRAEHPEQWLPEPG